MKDIRLSEYDLYDLLNMIQVYAELKTREAAQALEDEKAGKIAIKTRYTNSANCQVS